MTEREIYTQSSLELHLFFLRIMKEHALFLSVGFESVNHDFFQGSLRFKQQFEQLLARSIKLGNNRIRPELLNSCELVTGCTLTAEQQTEKLTGIPIQQKLTHFEEAMKASCSAEFPIELSQDVKQLNQQVLILLNGFIRFQETILEHVKCCRMFLTLYPSVLSHLLQESLDYREQLMTLDHESCKGTACGRANESFWNQRMMEHALTYRGMLDPMENKEIVKSNTFAEIYADLLDLGSASQYHTLTETEKFRDFNQTLTVGLTECELKSVLLPLLADHMLRETNHVLRLLRQQPPSQLSKCDSEDSETEQ